MNRETGEIFENVKSMDDLPKGAKKTDYVRNPTPRQLEQFARSARIKAMLKRQGDTPAKDRALDKKKLGRALGEMMSDENILRDRRSKIGMTDFRKGGMVISTVDRLKRRK